MQKRMCVIISQATHQTRSYLTRNVSQKQSYFIPNQQQLPTSSNSVSMRKDNILKSDIGRNVYIMQKRSLCTRVRHRVVKPGTVGPERLVPRHIPRPSYVSETWTPGQSGIIIKNERQIAGIWEACQVALNVLNLASRQLTVGMTTDDIDKLVHETCIAYGAYPSTLRYKGFPKSVCTSVNNVVCHGIPDNCPLVDGDIINIDVTVYYKGFHGDVNKTYPIGSVDEEGLHLVRMAEHACVTGIQACGPGVKFAEIGKAIEPEMKEAGLTVIPLFCGHGIGEDFHEPPDIYHIANEESVEMKEGMVFTVGKFRHTEKRMLIEGEPIISEGGSNVEFLEDGWTVVTSDESRTAAWEHTVVITRDGVEVLTL
ncbi:methionine aminopeptidase 1D, mitochondrial-like [Lingula anatina]|uniref:Methionine aminopeptidase n=1 Tax=Lingula anatina TaxID=7574 RepID=A0A1S3IV36_LINAN|nr:methionine aminopeptidase 1D, mitochondrial-like [Lingula anatina]|eukprot:XP_013402062.1 methionine aminopeptidase 1D, mitochondrial-like [Lingula anatina]